MSQSDNNLRTLGIFHYVYAAVVAFFALIPLLYLAMGIVFAVAPWNEMAGGKGASEPPPPIVGILFSAFGGFGVLLVLGVATLVFLAGRNLQRTRNYTLCMITAGLCCLFVPLGTVLGIFTLIELTKSDVRVLFERSPGDGPRGGS